jgi:chromosome segregation ATPase
MKINIDSKTIAILILSGLLLLVAYKWYFTYDDQKEYKNRIKELTEENTKLSNTRDSLDLNIKKLQIEYDSISLIESSLYTKIGKLNSDIEKLKNKSKQSEKELGELQEKLRKIKEKIEDLENKPNTKDDDELLESLKNNFRI